MCWDWEWLYRRDCRCWFRWLWNSVFICLVRFEAGGHLINLQVITAWCDLTGGSTALIAIRILMGVFQGPMFPALTHILSMWIPAGERAFLISVVYSGVDVSKYTWQIVTLASWCVCRPQGQPNRNVVMPKTIRSYKPKSSRVPNLWADAEPPIAICANRSSNPYVFHFIDWYRVRVIFLWHNHALLELGANVSHIWSAGHCLVHFLCKSDGTHPNRRALTTNKHFHFVGIFLLWNSGLAPIHYCRWERISATRNGPIGTQ